MSDAWVPSRWPTVPLGRIFQKQTRAPRAQDGVVTAFRDGQVVLRSRRRTEGFTEAIQEIGYQGIRKGDLVIHAMDAFAGAIGVSEDDGKSSPVYTALTPTQLAEPRFFAYVLRNFAVSGAIQSLGQGIRERSTDFRWATAKTVPVPLPPLDEQRRIADYLDHETAEIDALVDDLNALITLLEQRIRHERLRVFGPQGALVSPQRLKRVAHIVSGAGFPLEYQGEAGNDIPFFKVGTLKNALDGKLVTAPDTISYTAAAQLRATVIPAGSVIMAKIGAALFLNRNAMVQRPSCIDNNMVALIPSLRVLPEFLSNVLMTLDLNPLANPGAVPSLNMDWFRESEVWIPSLDEQSERLKRFAYDRTQLQDSVLEARLASELAVERRAALISAAVTGQIDVTEKRTPVTEELESALAEA